MPNPNYRNPPPRKPDLAKMEALRVGKIKYQGGDCIRKHGGLRYSKSGQCVECVAEYRDKNALR